MVVRFGSPGDQGRQLRTTLEAKGIVARKVPPAYVKAFEQSRGTRGKADRIDAELQRLFLCSPTRSGTQPCCGKNASSPSIGIDASPACSAHRKLGTAAIFDDIDTELKGRLDFRIKDLEKRSGANISCHDTLSKIAVVPRSIRAIGPVATTKFIVGMSDLGAIPGEQAAALAGLEPVAHDSGTHRGTRAIAGGHCALRHVIFQPARDIPAGAGRRAPLPKLEALLRSVSANPDNRTSS